MENLLMYLLLGAGVALVARKGDEVSPTPVMPVSTTPVLPGPISVVPNPVSVSTPKVTNIALTVDRNEPEWDIIAWDGVNTAIGYGVRASIGTVVEFEQEYTIEELLSVTRPKIWVQLRSATPYKIEVYPIFAVLDGESTAVMLTTAGTIPLPTSIPVISIIPVVTGPLGAGVIELTNWETLTPGWDFTGYTPSIDSTGNSPAGGSALRFAYPAGNHSTSVSGGRAVKSINPTDELWVGHWNKYSSNFVWNHNGTKMDFVVWDNNNPGVNNMSIGFYGSGCGVPGGDRSDGMTITPQIIWGPKTKNFCLGANFTRNVWQWVQYRLVMNTPGVENGIFELWLDGVKKASVTNVPYRSLASQHFVQFIHTAEWGGGGGTIPPNMHWWVDRTVLSTTKAPTDMP